MGRSVVLCELTSADMAILWDWRNQDRFMSLCSTRRNTVSLDQFRTEIERDFSRDRHLQFIIRRKRDGEPIGTIYTYGFNKTDSHVFVTIFVIEEVEGFGYGPEALTVFLKYLFSELKLHKVYLEVYEYNTHSTDCIRSAGFNEEGRFREHRRVGDKRYDLIRFAIYLHHLKEQEQLLNRLTKGE